MLFFFVVWIPFLVLYFLPDWDLQRITPFFFKEAINSPTLYSWAEVYQLFIGYEMILVLIPYCEGRGFGKGLFIGQAFTSLIYLMANVTISGYFGIELLQKLTYPVLNLLSYIEFPFINRIESLSFTLFVFNSLSKAAIYCFAALLLLKRLFPSVHTKWLALAIISIFYLFASEMKVMRQSEYLYQMVNIFEIALAFFSPILLLILLFHQQASRKRRA
ncbi:hypothetical protein EDM59_15675 [Brevibacillus nitrificans]|uniref:Uncharacterized protein n=1 Tax=Brevibacillus nitrificans TaxID=651560 RepID=A0A3M8D783_9BACL|nr:hypothetical protein EDM59_15675 [Brevibacillus nitrificans]